MFSLEMANAHALLASSTAGQSKALIKLDLRSLYLLVHFSGVPNLIIEAMKNPRVCPKNAFAEDPP